MHSAENGVTLDSHLRRCSVHKTSRSNVLRTSVESFGNFGLGSVVVVWAFEEDAAIPDVFAIGRGRGLCI